MTSRRQLACRSRGRLTRGFAVAFTLSTIVAGFVAQTAFAGGDESSHPKTAVTLTKAADKSEYHPGETIRYTLTVTNTGAVGIPLASVQVTDATVSDLAPTQPTPAELAPGTSHTWTASRLLAASDCGTVTNTASVQVISNPMTGSYGGSPAEATHAAIVTCATSLGITKVADKATYAPGETIRYTVTVKNTGQTALPAANISVSDPSLPTLALSSPPVNHLAPGAELVFTGSRAVSATDCGPIRNTATVRFAPSKPAREKHPKSDTGTKPYARHTRASERATSNALRANGKPTNGKKAEKDHPKKGTPKHPKDTPKHPKEPKPPKHVPKPPPIEASASVTVTVVCAINISLAKTTDKATYMPGETVTYTVTVTNTGTRPVPTAQIVLADPTLPTLTAIAPIPGELAPGASITFTGTRALTALDCGMVTNVATVSLPGDTNPADNTATVTVPVAGEVCKPVTIIGAPAPPTTTITVAKDGPASAKSRREMVPYRISVTNSGTYVASAVVVRDRIPSGLAAARIPKGATIKNGVVTWAVGDLAPGQTVTIGIYLVRTANRAVRICNEASAESGTAPRVSDKACTRFVRVAGVRRIPVAG